MPELPEVETVRRVLDERFRGRAITAVAVGNPTFYREPPLSAVRALTGGTIAAFRRRGKYLIVDIKERDSVVFHLGMSGRLTIGGESPHVRFQFWVGTEAVRFHDSRRFGRVGCPLPALGPEPMDAAFDADYLWKLLRRRSAPVKAQIHGTFGGLSDAVIQNFRNLESAKYLTQIAKLDAENLHSQIKLLSVMNSKSWRITKPLRVLTNFIWKANAK